VAKKARKKLEEDAAPAFEFPEFDLAGFVWKEFELASATALAGVIALVLGLVAWVLTAVAGLNGWIVFAVGILGLIGSVFLLQRARPYSHIYTKGDWAGLLALEFFAWLALWFLLLNIAPAGV
jgi:hypothetical protein